ncbi:hypothetical protein [Marinitenerispora sediminis]|uniref:Streptomyces killer toxin-like beta/gamma crystallin domain-containing protein n=1 Tax=Marinitenerispora sediminis TaxID=1931232 RepID=A0A368T9F1_9ACTN|nr:hypothetical protein [Marinitenerispora sediminis]RCV54610.1 hypothetical protein DEF28_07930 [Marinitenerispora sediminis]RCV59835.1 hypothetical protein DEF23_06135 [Marinitenerispora sediminis]RCV61162.1 hypothetical protein DEF24_04845 [Marinitenerispora sediminis]
MSAFRRGRAIASSLLVGLLLTFGLSVAAASPASAAGTFRLCNVASDYTATAHFPDRGGFSTHVVSPGQCTSVSTNGGENFYVQIRNSGGRNKATTLYHIPSGRSMQFSTGGTFAAPQYTPQVY